MNKLTKFLVTGVLSILATSAAMAEAQFTMRIATGANSAGFNCKEFLPAWAEKVKAESGGRIDYKLYCDGTLGRMGDTITRVQNGVADVGWDAPLAYGGRFSAFGTVSLPALFEDPVEAAGALWRVYENGSIPSDPSVKLVLIQVFGNISLWSTGEIENPASLKGLKFGMGSRERAIMLEKMGGIPLTLRVPEYYQSLAKGAAFGLFSNDAAILDYSLTELTKHVYRAPFGAGIANVYMNRRWYEKLPADLKAIIDANTGYESSKWASRILWEDDLRNVKKAQAEKGLVVHQLSEEELKAWKPAFDAAQASWVASVANGQTYLDAFKTALEVERAKQ
ncbi:TRAP transporter substrate-binding protein DctP [Rhizobium sp.]|uniref:TRAP transporter substrate-binding protein DctP n=1 Tax=Rhizobium sp. TaxID=391 RepID=UPI0034C632C1